MIEKKFQKYFLQIKQIVKNDKLLTDFYTRN